MGLLSILGRLTLDGSGFDTTLKNADKKASQFASGMTKKLVGAAAGFAGFNALKQMGLAAIERSVEIEKLAKSINVTTDQVQLLEAEAKRTGIPFNDLVKDATALESTLKRLDGGEVIFSEKTVRNLNLAAEFMQAFKDAVGERVGGFLGGIAGVGAGVAMSPEQQAVQEIMLERKRKMALDAQDAAAREKDEEKILKIHEEARGIEEKTADEGKSKAEHLNNLIEKRRKMLDEIKRIPHEPGSEGEANDRLRVAKINDLIAGLQRGETTTAKSKTFAPMSDSLTSVGNFLGANPNAETRSQLTEANRTLKSMDRKLSELKTGGTNFPL